MTNTLVSTKARRYLLWGAGLSSVAALLHLGCIVFGAPWYRFFGAGEQMARLAEAGDPLPTLVTALISLVLLVWAVYAVSGAGLIRRLPLLRLVLLLIAGVYLLRGLMFPFMMSALPENSLLFWLLSSAICLLFGVVYALGLWHAWSALAPAKR